MKTRSGSKPSRLIRDGSLPGRQGNPPAYLAVMQSLRQRLREGTWSPGARLPTLQTLGREFKVSTSTIRGALRVLEKEGCIYQVPDVGAFVSPTYTGNAALRTVIAVSAADIADAFEMNVVRGILHACQERGWDVHTVDAQHDSATEAANLARLANTGSRGAVLMPVGNCSNIEHLFKLKIAGYPFVLVNRGIIGLQVDLVESDNQRGAMLAVEHLLERGHRQPFMLTEHILPVPESWVLSRVQGFDHALSKHHLASRDSMIWMDSENRVRGTQQGRRWLAGYEAVMPILKSAAGPLSIFALDDWAAWGAVQACRALKLRIPEDVSIVAFDDSDITRALDLTVVAQRPGDMGRKAIELLERRLVPGGMELPPEHVKLQIELIERGSVADLR